MADGFRRMIEKKMKDMVAENLKKKQEEDQVFSSEVETRVAQRK